MRNCVEERFICGVNPSCDCLALAKVCMLSVCFFSTLASERKLNVTSNKKQVHNCLYCMYIPQIMIKIKNETAVDS